MGKRQKIDVTEAFADRVDFEEAIDKCSRIQVKIDQLEADKKAATNKVLDKYNGAIKLLKAEQKSLNKECAKYALLNRETLLKKLKSAKTKLSNWGFRLSVGGKPVKGFDAGMILQKIKDAGRTDLLRIKEEVNLDALRRLTDAEREQFGARLATAESFFFEALAAKTDPNEE